MSRYASQIIDTPSGMADGTVCVLFDDGDNRFVLAALPHVWQRMSPQDTRRYVIELWVPGDCGDDTSDWLDTWQLVVPDRNVIVVNGGVNEMRDMGDTFAKQIAEAM